MNDTEDRDREEDEKTGQSQRDRMHAYMRTYIMRIHIPMHTCMCTMDARAMPMHIHSIDDGCVRRVWMMRLRLMMDVHDGCV
jgi:hypothetical protein